MSTLLIIFLATILAALFLLIRVEVVTTARLRELDRARDEAQALAAECRDWRAAYDAYDKGPSFDAQTFMFTKWTHAQFYPQRGAE